MIRLLLVLNQLITPGFASFQPDVLLHACICVLLHESCSVAKYRITLYALKLQQETNTST